ncbi:addiction module antitoxin [Paraburkholderia strydomiana]|uniref:Addiction module antitoxin n=1 Tax=Paraburkholderia strydomiana TaxID=1245417 RepID=A0ABW9EAL9_9BURK
MSRPTPTTMTVRLSGPLSDFVAANVGEHGAYENVSEYVRDLIRRDKERQEAEAFERLKAELAGAYSAPESSYKPLTATDVIARNRAR